jgi:hypothetical protein
MSLTIGLSGVAGAGKDLFFSLLKRALIKNEIRVYRLALADSLKCEVSSFLLKEYGVNIFDCDRATKNLYRPFLVFHGKIKRSQTNGRYWIDKISSRIDSKEKHKIFCITDIRYAEFKKDELYWLREEKKGILVHVSQYSIEGNNKIFKLPPNEDEAKNDPILKNAADYKVEWPRIEGSQGFVEAVLWKEVEDFIVWLKKNERHGLRFS